MNYLSKHIPISIAFVDTEIESQSKTITDIGGIKTDGSQFHSASLKDFSLFIQGSNYICGHNILKHDIKYIGSAILENGLSGRHIIDTLYLSPLLFPTSPYHALLKDDKLQIEEANNPLNDSIKAKELFYDEVTAFNHLPNALKDIYFLLLRGRKEFHAFFHIVSHDCQCQDIAITIRSYFRNQICAHIDLEPFITNSPIELAYALSLIHSLIHHEKDSSITPPWVLKNFPMVERIMFQLRNTPCEVGCDYCNDKLNIFKGLKRYFGYDSYRSYGNEPLQEKAVRAAMSNQSLLAVFPTGGGKSLTFQVPALLNAESCKGLTVVISPLQSLMKDQVDNLERMGIVEAVTINGLLDPIERAKAFERIANGSASILYISPESLRSKSIEHLILNRKVVRFVIDEAHCFSSWGQDFRVDYLYIADFINAIQTKKGNHERIAISCFTATAKQKVIADIQNYFRDKLNLELQLFTAKVGRENLHYKVFENENDETKYQKTRSLIEEKNCPTIIYVSRTHNANRLAKRLVDDGYCAKAYHGKMEKDQKSANQDSFILGETQVMVATSAFGMGVDKKDVGMVIHYDISDSLENYIQEAGRAGRDEHVMANCYVLYNDDDLSKHFILLNQTKLTIKEINQIWKAIKDITRFRNTVSNSALEIARKAGWDDSVLDIETRVKTAIAALEDANLIKRGQNMPRIFANSILAKNAQEAIEKINVSERFNSKQKQQAVRIIKKLFSCKSRKESEEESAESRIDYISDHLGIVKEEVINIITLLREEQILADAKDLTAFIKRGEHKNRSLKILEEYSHLERFLLSHFEEQEKQFYIKQLNEAAEEASVPQVSSARIKNILNFWAIKNWIQRKNLEGSKNHVAVTLQENRDAFLERMEKRFEIARFIVEHLFEVSKQDKNSNPDKAEVLVEFSVNGLKDAYLKSNLLFQREVDVETVEDALFYLSRIESINIEGGFRSEERRVGKEC